VESSWTDRTGRAEKRGEVLRLGGQIKARNRIAVQQRLVNRIGAQSGRVVGLRITIGDGEHALLEKILQRVIDLARLPLVAQTPCHAGDSLAVFPSRLVLSQLAVDGVER